MMLNIWCKTHKGKFEKEMLYGKWIPVKDTMEPDPDTVIIDKVYFRQVAIDLTSRDNQKTETLWRYTMNADTLPFHLTTLWDIEEKIICLNADSFISQSMEIIGNSYTYARYSKR